MNIPQWKTERSAIIASREGCECPNVDSAGLVLKRNERCSITWVRCSGVLRRRHVKLEQLGASVSHDCQGVEKCVRDGCVTCCYCGLYIRKRKPMNIYVASSWRNLLQPGIVHALRRCGHSPVYDFKHPEPGNEGFSWKTIDPNWENWTPDEYRKALQHPLALKGYGLDIAALKACDAVVLVRPSGRSASWEFGYAMGQGKKGYVVQLDKVEPELMYREAVIITSMNELFDAFGEPKEAGEP